LSKILIIDDDLFIITILKDLFTKEGYQVVACRDGYSAVEITHKQKPDLIILDMLLPGGGGLSILKRIKLSNHINKIPIVALSSLKDDESKNKAFSQGVDAYIEKPYDEKNLLDTIKSLIEKTKIIKLKLAS